MGILVWIIFGAIAGWLAHAITGRGGGLIVNIIVGIVGAFIILSFMLTVSIALAQAPEGEEYVVQADDWLSKIAEKEYGDLLAYPAIVEATNAKAAEDDSFAVIDNPDLIEVGQKLWLPASVESGVTTDSTAPAAGDSRLTADQLQNGTYSGIYEEPVTLTEGRYEGEPFVEGGASRPIVEYIDGSVRYGDLDGDGVEDAVLFLTESSGGSGTFVYVAAQLNQGGQPVDAGAVWIEDRIQVKSATIENGQVMLVVTAEGPGDAACCKSHLTSQTYVLQNGQLADISGEGGALVRVSAADLNGTSWTLLEIDEQPALAETEVTISFQDGQISGSGGCNSYNSSFTLDEENPFVMSISPVAATRMACPEPILDQETAYFTALENVSLWGYDIGRLGFTYFEGEGSLPKRLLFSPADSAEATETGQLDRLTGSTWQWVRFTDPTQQFEVDQPENYTITFNPDDTVNIKADCKEPGGGYAADESGSLSISVDPVITVICSEESRSDEFIQKLGFGAIYFFQDGNLFIDLMADGGTLELSP